jgi:hypothetical protein
VFKGIAVRECWAAQSRIEPSWLIIWSLISSSKTCFTMTKHRKHNNAHPAIRGYLVLYNAVQGIGWSLCLAACIKAAYKGNDFQSIFLAGSVYASECSTAAGAAV